MKSSDLEIVAKQAQDHYHSDLAIILGSGASAAFNMSGMWKLSKHLKDYISPTLSDPSDTIPWKEFCDLLDSGIDLEAALHKAHLPPGLSNKVVLATWNLLNPEDLNVFNESLQSHSYFPLGKLISHYLRSTKDNINIITTNYDRLAEYACEQEGIHHYTGFSHGYRRRAVGKDYLTARRQVNIWKVHGSLDWFAKNDGTITALGNIDCIPHGLTPLIVTPGTEKYRNTHKEPYKTIIHASDDVLDAAKSYFCVGFGFNDEHIQEKLVNRCFHNSAKVTVITYALTEAAKKFLLGGGANNYLAIERGDSDNKSVVYSSLFPGPIQIDGDYWSLKGFLALII